MIRRRLRPRFSLVCGQECPRYGAGWWFGEDHFLDGTIAWLACLLSASHAAQFARAHPGGVDRSEHSVRQTGKPARSRGESQTMSLSVHAPPNDTIYTVGLRERLGAKVGEVCNLAPHPPMRGCKPRLLCNAQSYDAHVRENCGSWFSWDWGHDREHRNNRPFPDGENTHPCYAPSARDAGMRATVRLHRMPWEISRTILTINPRNPAFVDFACFAGTIIFLHGKRAQGHCDCDHGGKTAGPDLEC